MSARDPPLDRRVVNSWCPGVSMKSNPGNSRLSELTREPAIFETISIGTVVIPIC